MIVVKGIVKMFRILLNVLANELVYFEKKKTIEIVIILCYVTVDLMVILAIKTTTKLSKFIAATHTFDGRDRL